MALVIASAAVHLLVPSAGPCKAPCTLPADTLHASRRAAMLLATATLAIGGPLRAAAAFLPNDKAVTVLAMDSIECHAVVDAVPG